MIQKRNIIIGIDYNQEYLAEFVKCIDKELNVYLIHYSSPSESSSTLFEKYGSILYWKDFHGAYDLLEKLDPFKVVFFELETLNQVALNVACKEKKIKTVFCDHGLSLMEPSLKLDRVMKPQMKFSFSKFKRNPFHVVRNRLFYVYTVKNASKKGANFLKEFKNIRLENSILQTYLEVDDKLLYPTEYYCISPENYKFQSSLNKDSDIPVSYFGFLDFDHMFHVTQAKNKKHLLYIDQPYAKGKLFGWSVQTKAIWIDELAIWCDQNDFDLVVKKHPRESEEVWKAVTHSNINYTNDLISYLPSTQIVVGFNSTLLVSLAALDHIVLFCVRFHPDGNENETEIFINEGVANWIDGVTSLVDKKDIHSIWQKQRSNKSNFCERWLYKKDGNSARRLKELYLKD
ncbi:MAG: polysialyltransferase family glycosyltransferase [Cyclobacteriaceae bacterium]